jgi:hypothetical protein
VTPFNGQYVFSVVSNSTVSALAFNSGTRELSFNVTGPTGTTGFADVAIAKSLVSNIANLTVYLDGVNLNYVATSTADSWLLHFEYAHSTHSITVNLGSQTPNPTVPEFPTAAILAAIMAIQLFAIATKKKKRSS